MKVKSMLVKIGADDSELQDSLNKSRSKLKDHSAQFKKIGRTMTVIGAAISATFVMMVKKASDAQETSAKFGTVFKDAIGKANAAAKDLVKNYGLSTLASKTMLSATGDLLTGLGVQGDVALSLSAKTQKLAVDLASFANFSGGAKGASEALTKAMLGERESAKSLGIVITEEMVKEELLSQGKGRLTGQAKLQAKAEATLTIAYRQSKNAIGDYARTKGDLANMARTLLARLEDLWVKLGTFLIPTVTKVIAKVKEIVGSIVTWIQENPKLAGTITKVAAVLGGLMLVLGPIAMVLPGLVSGFTMMGGAFTAMLGPVGLAVIAITTLAVVIKTLAGNLKDAKKEMSDFADEATVFAKAAENFKTLWAVVRKEGGESLEQFNELIKRFGGNWDKILKQIIKDPKFASLKAILMDVAGGVKTIDLEGKNLSITLPDSFLKIEKAAEQTGKKIAIGWGWVAQAFHDASVKAGEIRQKLGEIDFKSIIPPAAISMPKFTLGTEEFETFGEWYKAWLEELKEKWRSTWFAALDGAREVTGALNTVFGQFHENEAIRIDNEERQKTGALESWYKSEQAKIEATITNEEAKNEALAALEEKKAKKEAALAEKIEKERRKLARKRAKAQRMGALFAAGINVAEAITKMLTAGPLIGQILAGITAVLGGIQIAAIASAPLPSYKEGGSVSKEMIARLHPGEHVLSAPTVRALTSPAAAGREPTLPSRFYIDITTFIGEEQFHNHVVKVVNRAGELGDLRVPIKVVVQ